MPLFSHERIRQVLELPKVTSRRAAVAEAVEAAIAAGTFTITDCFLLPDPLRSDTFEHLDGVTFEQNDLPLMGRREPLNPFPSGVPLAHRQPAGRIRCYEPVQRPVFGTDRMRTDRIDIDKGNAALLRDDWPHRHARMVLYRFGLLPDRPEDLVQVFELAWLRQHVEGPGPHGSGLPEVYQEIMGRENVRKLLAEREPKHRVKAV